ncbi:ankyrin repeat-containing protein [Tanacetum coccineum]
MAAKKIKSLEADLAKYRKEVKGDLATLGNKLDSKVKALRKRQELKDKRYEEISRMMGEDNNSWGDCEGFEGSNRINIVTNNGTMKDKNRNRNTIRTGFGTGANHTEGRFDYDHQMRKIKMPLFDGEDAHTREPFRSWEELKRRLLDRFQPSQEGNLYEQFLVITQDVSAREYVGLLEQLASQLRGVSEEVMEGTFIKSLKPDLRSSAQSSSQVVVPLGGQTTIKREHFRKMTESELEESRAKGLCFWCEEKYKPRHQYAPHTLHMMIVDDSDAIENEPYL